jgi:ADP-heptose:LPS heptosyltransferase
LKNCELFSFQRGPQADDLRKIPEFGSALQIDSSAGSMETAAFMLHMDLMLTVDTFAAHLAGALGRPAFVMLPFCADWRWMLDRRDSPWYPTMRLFRQPAPGSWEPVIREVACELDRMF